MVKVRKAYLSTFYPEKHKQPELYRCALSLFLFPFSYLFCFFTLQIDGFINMQIRKGLFCIRVPHLQKASEKCKVRSFYIVMNDWIIFSENIYCGWKYQLLQKQCKVWLRSFLLWGNGSNFLHEKLAGLM